ncbi:hypothetical protein BGW38_009388 [Lunasporangiospora selenospora]|uniref:Peroxin/Ferlin domain-containing protein n=1 Tax=Lunasporangiospora selenospora TaxID=979761 RepID=A0A9P6FYI3_9FUNG|nr:hypothetical protein BGW38_009388 [Lunasporangiospora selenospora]
MTAEKPIRTPDQPAAATSPSPSGTGSIPINKESPHDSIHSTSSVSPESSKHNNSHQTKEEQDSFGHHTETHKNESDSIDSDSSCECGISAIHNIHQLTGVEAQQEAQRAAERIQSRLRPMSKLNTMRKDFVQSFQQEQQALSDSSREQCSTAEVLADEAQDSASASRSNASEHLSSVASSIVGVSNSSISRIKQKMTRSDPSRETTHVITIEPPRQIDAQTQAGDRRYYRCSGDPEPEGDFVYEFLYQHQRGAFFLGTPKFSAKSLLPVDPDEWTNTKFETSVMNTTDYVLPDPSWEWVHKSWLVDMTGDVDEDGWEYAMTFHGSPWHGNYEIFRSFSRRRRWLRLRKRKGTMQGKAGAVPERGYPTLVDASTWRRVEQSISEAAIGGPSTSTNGTGPTKLDAVASEQRAKALFKAMKGSRSDREKVAHAAQHVVQYPYPNDFKEIEAKLEKYLSLFDYETSRREFLLLLATYGRTVAVEEGAQQLEFFSDRKLLATRVLA